MSRTIRISLTYPIGKNQSAYVSISVMVDRETADRILSRVDAPGVGSYTTIIGEKFSVDYDIEGLEIKETRWP